jgi:hypothetical protein
MPTTAYDSDAARHGGAIEAAAEHSSRLSMPVPRRLSTACVTVCAHRGASGTHCENTLEAFAEAVRLGCDMLEFDVRARGGLTAFSHVRMFTFHEHTVQIVHITSRCPAYRRCA